MGVPVIALEGTTSIARGTSSLLRTLGRPEWIAASPAEYVALNLRLADETAERTAAMHGLRAQMLASPLMDAPRFVRDLECALARMAVDTGGAAPAGDRATPGRR